MSRTPLPGAWTGAKLERSGQWLRAFDDGHRAEIAAALAAVTAAGLPETGFGRADFPLDRTATLLAEVAGELETGCGAVRLQGLDVERYDEAALRRIFWGIGAHLGVALYQNSQGEIMGAVRDEGGTMPAPGKVLDSRARARSTGPLRFHTDRCDVIALLAARNSKAGGISKLASIKTIHNEMLRRRPDLLELLFQPYWRRRAEDIEAAKLGRFVALPVFGLRDGQLTSQYSRTFVEQAQEDPGIPRLTAAQDEALDLLAEIAEASCLHAPFAPGDIQLLNNHVVYHGRTAYENDAAAGQERLLLRLWLAMPGSRALPPGFETYWGDTAAGVVRGGTLQADGRRSPGVSAAARMVPALA
ncbi:TauD/TfdA family dioxygenase [Paeniroseomonas aquatica]|uniref:TauD/TfdA family dioxygenase n=1 Tax=Paeniroseomonas aquatica TaxID=373043 RepID=A0ABT8ADR7_9PROT|nr:TauD/TfdA family dioxygenase [Paeniroseomonas aquatica]MDN3567805.1 TauD/TfdA family dioxygenase [Paeniroseomonas aquatica]